MKPLTGYKEAKAYTDQEALPVGGYILKIMNAKEMENQWGSTLVISFDIAEGEFKGYFAENYKNQTQEDKKWKGTFRLSIPNDDGSEQDQWKYRAMKTAMEMGIEASNPGYHWDWDETKLKGKMVGGVFGKKEYDFNGRRGFYVTCFGFKAADLIRQGKFKLPADRLLKGSKSVNSDDVPDGFEAISDDEIPF